MAFQSWKWNESNVQAAPEKLPKYAIRQYMKIAKELGYDQSVIDRIACSKTDFEAERILRDARANKMYV